MRESHTNKSDKIRILSVYLCLRHVYCSPRSVNSNLPAPDFSGEEKCRTRAWQERRESVFSNSSKSLCQSRLFVLGPLLRLGRVTLPSGCRFSLLTREFTHGRRVKVE